MTERCIPLLWMTILVMALLGAVAGTVLLNRVDRVQDRFRRLEQAHEQLKATHQSFKGALARMEVQDEDRLFQVTDLEKSVTNCHKKAELLRFVVRTIGHTLPGRARAPDLPFPWPEDE